MSPYSTAVPSSAEYRRLLGEVSSSHQVEDGYWDIWGRRHETSAEVCLAILGSLGVASRSEQELRRAIASRERAIWGRLAPQTVVAAEKKPLAIELRLPEGSSTAELALQVTLEDGRQRQWRSKVESCARTGEAEVEGYRYTLRRLEIEDPIPLGYHELEVSLDGGERCKTQLIVCPEKAWLPEPLRENQRRAGLAVSLYGLRSERTWGCGDFTALAALIDWVADQLQGSYIALNPLHAIHNRLPFNTSPYLPNTLFYRNPIYLDMERIPEIQDSRLAQRLLASEKIRDEIAGLNAAELVDYEGVHGLKRRFLKVAFRHFRQRELKQGTARAAQFLAWVEEEGELLERYAVYSALDEHLHRQNPEVWTWADWPAEYREPESEAVGEFAREKRRSVQFHKYVQWLLDEQGRQAQRHALESGMEIGLFHDLPLATDRYGFELWAHRPYYVDGCRVGAPPDDFAPKGQDWSFPPPNTEQHKAGGYRLFAQAIRHSARHGGALRIDHVMRLFRLYWIPDGFDATEGTYVRDNYEELLGVLALESVREKILIVGEDLGTVEPYMRDALRRFGILSYRLLYFERGENGRFRPPHEYPVQALVSSTTHDLPTLAGFWSGRDIELRAGLGLLDEEGSRRWQEGRREDKRKLVEALVHAGLLAGELSEAAAQSDELTGELHNAIAGFLVSTPSLLMTLNQEDLTKEAEQQNLPGTTEEYPNWRRKMRFSLEQLHESKEASDFAAMFRHWLAREQRAIPGGG